MMTKLWMIKQRAASWDEQDECNDNSICGPLTQLWQKEDNDNHNVDANFNVNGGD